MKRIDVPRWSLSSSGDISVRSLRSLMPSRAHARTQHQWSTIWQFKGPGRPSFTLWGILHKALPTVEFLWKRHILPQPTCVWCNHATQSIIHLLRDCYFAHAVWLLPLPTDAILEFFSPFIDIIIGLIYLGKPSMRFGRTTMMGIIMLLIFLEDPYALAEKSLRKTLELLRAWA